MFRIVLQGQVARRPRKKAHVLEELQHTIVSTRRRRKCALGRFMETLNDKDQRIVEELLVDYAVSHAHLADSLRPYVEDPRINLTENTVGRHRRRGHANGCSCP